MGIFLLLLFSGIIRGIGYVVSKHISLGKGSSHAMALANATVDTILSLPIGIYLIIQTSAYRIDTIVLFLCVLSAAIYGLSISLQYSALKRIDMSVMGIVLRLNILFSSLIGVIVLGEKMNEWNYLGLFAILIGNFIVLSKKGKFNISYGVVFVILAALCSAFASNLDKFILNYINSAFYVTLNSFLIMFTLFLMRPRALKESISLIKGRFKLFLLFSCLNIIAWYFASYVLQNMDVSKFVPIQKTITLIIPVLSGILIFKEKENIKQKLIGLGLAIIGITLMYL